MARFAIHICGRGCSGKTSLAEALGAKFPGAYLIAYDKLKWQIFGYDRNNMNHRSFLKRMQLCLFDFCCDEGVSIITDYFPDTESEFADLEARFQKHGYQFVCVGLTAPEDVLLKRFRERVKEAKEKRWKISLTDEKIFLEKQSFIPEQARVWDTSKTDVTEIAEILAASIKK